MKKLLPLITIILFTISVKAQIPLTKELTCTEEAFTVRLNLHSGWYPGVVRLGSVQTTSYAMTPAIDYLPIYYNMQKAEKPAPTFFHFNSKPDLEKRSSLFDKNSTVILGLSTKPIYRDSLSFLHSYK